MPQPALEKALTFDAWMAQRGEEALNPGRTKKVSQGQMSLFDLLD